MLVVMWHRVKPRSRLLWPWAPETLDYADLWYTWIVTSSRRDVTGKMVKSTIEDIEYSIVSIVTIVYSDLWYLWWPMRVFLVYFIQWEKAPLIRLTALWRPGESMMWPWTHSRGTWLWSLSSVVNGTCQSYRIVDIEHAYMHARIKMQINK